MNLKLEEKVQLSSATAEAVEAFSLAGLPTESLAVPSYETEGNLISVRVSDSEVIVFTDWEGFSDSKTNKLQSWLILEGTPVAYVSLYLGKNPTGQLPDVRETVIGSLEVREGYRGQKLSFHLAMLLQDYTGHTIHSSGHYTPEGFRSMAGLFPYTRETLERDEANKASGSKAEQIGVWFDSTNFVKDWDTLKISST